MSKPAAHIGTCPHCGRQRLALYADGRTVSHKLPPYADTTQRCPGGVVPLAERRAVWPQEYLDEPKEGTP